MQDIVVNLDKIEKILAKKNRRECNATMDIFLGVSKRLTEKKIALVEFKFDVKNPTGISKSDLEKKVNGSIGLLGNEKPILQRYYFVFNSNKIAQAQWWLNRLFSGKVNNPYQAVTEDILHQIYWE